MAKRKLIFSAILTFVFLLSNLAPAGAALLAPVEEAPSSLSSTPPAETPIIIPEAITSTTTTSSTDPNLLLPASDTTQAPVLAPLSASSTVQETSGTLPIVSEAPSPAPSAAPIPAKDSETRKNNFAKVLDDLAAISLQKSSGSSQISKIESDLNQVEADLESVKANLISKYVSQKILDRLELFKQNYTSKVQSILTELQSGGDAKSLIDNFLEKPIAKIENPTPFHAVEFSGQIKKAPASDFPNIPREKEGDLLKNLVESATLKVKNLLSPNSSSSTSLPTSDLQPQASSAPSLTSAPPGPADTAESEEIKFTQNIKNLAASLEYDPLTIFNYVVNNINYVPYYGSKKGADSTLLEKAGNDFDQASLLIALLRVGNGSGANQIPARYKQASVKLSVGEVMDLLGVEDPIVAATVLEKADIPYALYVDQNQNPLFFVIELTYVEAYVDYDYTRGAIQGNPGAPKHWVPLVPFLAKFYKSQHLNALDAMSFNVQTFYDNYLNGGYGVKKPIEALEFDIQNYLTANHPDLTPEDTYVQTYRSEEDLEFLPLTLPFEVVSDLGGFSSAPENLKHRLEFRVESTDGSQVFLDGISNVSSISNAELLLEYAAATPDDQSVIDSFPTIYDVVPLSLVNLKPVIKVNGAVKLGGGAGDPEIQMGRENKLKLIFKVPSKDLGGSVSEKIIETVEKTSIGGNSEGIAINTDSIAPPEIRPSQDTQTSSPVASQKLWKTAENFLYRLQTSHDSLARITGGRFTNAATRAIVFNGISVNYQSGEPYSFSWQGLRIDSSALINYYSHFSSQPELHQKEFLSVFGLEASQAEADIFENDYGVESISTVKGLKLINQNQIPGVTVKKISSANESDIDTLSISDQTKIKFRDAVHQGHVIYTPTAPFAYQNWTGLVYIDLNPQKGDGGYIIGEGLNGGYTACALPGQGKNGASMCEWSQGLFEFWKSKNVISSVQTVINLPRTLYTLGEKIFYSITYTLFKGVDQLLSFVDPTQLDSNQLGVGSHPIVPSYGAGGGSSNVEVKTKCLIGSENCDYDSLIIKYEDEFQIPRGLLKAIIHKETETSPFQPDQYRYEPGRDYVDFSGHNPTYNIITQHPYKHFALKGHKADGSPITQQGDQVGVLAPKYTQIVVGKPQGWAYRGLKGYTGSETFAELLALDTQPGSQNWLSTVEPTHPIQNPANRDFTAQVLLSASYGLGHVMYESAFTLALNMQGQLWFDTSTTGYAVSVYKMDEPDIAIRLAASVLRYKYDHSTPEQNSTACGSWYTAVWSYNGVRAYAKNPISGVCTVYYPKYKP